MKMWIKPETKEDEIKLFSFLIHNCKFSESEKGFRIDEIPIIREQLLEKIKKEKIKYKLNIHGLKEK